MKKILLLQFLLLFSFQAFSQVKKTITGVVQNSQKEPLQGVTVTAVGQNRTVITNEKGAFTIELVLPPPNNRANAKLRFSYIGFKAVEMAASGAFLNVTLEEEGSTLDDVVVVGYGTTSVRKNSTAVSTVNPAQLKQLPVGDMGSALQGRAPGLIIQQGSAEPGQNGATISIRGNGEPLYIIDGFVSTRQRFLTLNKEDIKSLTTLNDAASTAVYGMNAGNGVIVVTTKQGEAGDMQFNYQANFGFNTPSYAPERMNAYQYATAINKLNQALGQGANSFKTVAEMEDIQNNLSTYTNWEKSLLRDFAPQNEHSISVNGGNEKLRFFGSLNALGQGGIYKFNSLDYNRYNYRSNVSASFDKIGLTFDLMLNGTLLDEKYPPAGAGVIFSRLRDRNPFEKPFTSAGLVSNQFDNPALQLQSPGYIKLRTVYNQLGGVIKWNVPGVKGLSFGFNGNYNVNTQDRVDWVQTATYYDEQGNATKEDPSNIGVSRSSFLTSRYDLNTRADYKTTIANVHNIEATVVQNVQHYYDNTLTAGSRNFTTTEIKQIQKGDATLITGSNTEGEQAWAGYVGKFHYDFKNKYIFEFAGRYDGSDNFPDGKRWGFFPSVSAGWAVSEEKFFENLKKNGPLDYLKLRASYGQIGVNNINHFNYAYLPTYNYNTNNYVVNGQLVNTVSPGPTPSVNITWFDRTKYDVGLDFFMFKSKLQGKVDYFFEQTKGFLAPDNSRYTGPIGYQLPLVVSQAENRIEGIDGALDYKTKFGQVNFSAGFNFTYYKSLRFKTNESPDTLANPRIRAQGNETFFVGTGYVGAQIYTNPQDILNNPKRVTSRDLRPGDLWYKDVNGDGKIDGEDQSRFGHNTNPSFVFGVNLEASYKGLSVAATVQGTGARQTYMNGAAAAAEGERRLDFVYQLDTWTPENPNALFPRAGNASLNNSNNYATSDFWARDSYYVRLKSLTLSYDFKYAILNKQNWLRNLTIYTSGVNLFAVGPTVKYSDPEANNFDGYTYPMMRTYSFGLLLGF